MYVCSDFHGFMELYHKIKEKLNPEDIVYFLGDAADRGPMGWELIKTIYNDPQFIYIKGNHEDMLVQAVKDHINPPNYTSQAYERLEWNGGEQTFCDFIKEPNISEWIDKIDTLPVIKLYKNKDNKLILLSHAGFTPFIDTDTNDMYIPDKLDLIWDREHFYDNWEIGVDNLYIVHGHTPMQNLHRELMRPSKEFRFAAYTYCDGHKICIDCGTYRTGLACLLNLDTFEYEIIELDENIYCF